MRSAEGCEFGAALVQAILKGDFQHGKGCPERCRHVKVPLVKPMRALRSDPLAPGRFEIVVSKLRSECR
jgi:hypothetical protein